jgi:uncharacterized membrane protein YgcG
MFLQRIRPVRQMQPIRQMFHRYFTPFRISNVETLLSMTSPKSTCVSTGKWYTNTFMGGSGGSGGGSGGSGSGGCGGGSGGGGDQFVWLVILTTGFLVWRNRKGPPRGIYM